MILPVVYGNENPSYVGCQVSTQKLTLASELLVGTDGLRRLGFEFYYIPFERRYCFHVEQGVTTAAVVANLTAKYSCRIFDRSVKIVWASVIEKFLVGKAILEAPQTKLPIRTCLAMAKNGEAAVIIENIGCETLNVAKGQIFGTLSLGRNFLQ